MSCGAVTRHRTAQRDRTSDSYAKRTLWSRLLRFVHFWKSYGPRAAFGGAKAALLRVLLKPMYLRIDRRFDEKYDLDTVASVPLKELAIKSSHFKGSQDPRLYVATPSMAFSAAMAALPRDLRDYTLIDFGSGKGRMLLLAQSYNFSRVVGVEFSKDLYDVACRNVIKYGSIAKVTPNIELINDDAANYEVPNSPCVLYFFDPFGEDVMMAVLQNAAKSYHSNPRKLYFIYLGLRVPEVFDRFDFLKSVKMGNFASLNGMIYETAP